MSYREALNRIPSQHEKLIMFLKNAGEEGATNVELNQICLRYDSRISELRRKGYEIDVESVGKGIYKYILRKTPSIAKIYPNALDELMSAIENEKVREEIYTLLDLLGFTVIRKHGWYKDQQKLN